MAYSMIFMLCTDKKVSKNIEGVIALDSIAEYIHTLIEDIEKETLDEDNWKANETYRNQTFIVGNEKEDINHGTDN